LRYEAMTGLRNEQLTELVTRVHAAHGGGFSSRCRPYALGLFRSVALVVCLMRTNITQAFAGAIFGVSQATVSRRWDLLRPLIGQVLAEFVPHPSEVVGVGTVLVDGTVCPTWDWHHIPDLYSAKAGYPGMNIQIAATLGGHLAAVGPIPVHGARHDAHAFAASGLTALLADMSAAADWGMSVSRVSRSCRSNDFPATTSPLAKPSSTPLSAKSVPPWNTPSPTSRPGECSAKKEAGTAGR
jgi:hypothetical protein